MKSSENVSSIRGLSPCHDRLQTDSEQLILSSGIYHYDPDLRHYRNPYFPHFSHIYVEKQAEQYDLTKRILSRFPDANIILTDHYKDIFNRSRQNISEQYKSRKLILAVKNGQRIYKGAPLCQDFGNEHFYYSSCMMNCVFDCEYCYLKGMYPSADIVIFVNTDDYFHDVDLLLDKHPVYLCISYDTDLAAADYFTGYLDLWRKYSAEKPDLTIELRTKSAGKMIWRNCRNSIHMAENPENDDAGIRSVTYMSAETAYDCRPGVHKSDNMIYAFTLSPQSVIDKYEHRTPSLKARLLCAAEGLEKGFRIRLCFDPVMYIPDWKAEYSKMMELTSCMLDMERITDYSIGAFRIPKDYLKNMRKQMPYSSAAWYPYTLEEGIYRYDHDLETDMQDTLTGLIKKKVPGASVIRDDSQQKI